MSNQFYGTHFPSLKTEIVLYQGHKMQSLHIPSIIDDL